MVKQTLASTFSRYFPDQEDWARSIVQKYRLLELTKASDRLVAIGGIARLFQGMKHDQYLAGLWKETIIEDLYWYVDYEDTNFGSGPNRAPGRDVMMNVANILLQLGLGHHH